jgi:hypothetical protein
MSDPTCSRENDALSEALAYEQFLLPMEESLAECPWPEAVKEFREENLQGIPSAIGHHPQRGWFVLSTSGQGPYFVWAEWWPREDDARSV